MAEDVLEAEAGLRRDLEAAADEVLALVGEADAEAELRAADLLVGLEGDVAADHVEEEDAERPDGGLLAAVAAVADPLRWRVDPGA